MYSRTYVNDRSHGIRIDVRNCETVFSVNIKCLIMEMLDVPSVFSEVARKTCLYFLDLCT
jgi:hypothetical protein